MTLGQSLFDTLLTRQQPIHGLVQIIGCRRSQMERFGQRTEGGLIIQAAGGGQFGSRVEDAGGNESADEIAFRATSTGEQIREAEMAQGPEDSGDMAMRKGPADLEGLIAGDQIFPFQNAT